MGSLPTKTDLLIAGAGPAGLVAAIAARRKGLEVIVADRLAGPADKVCGEGLMPEAVETLHTLGVSLDDAEFQPLRGIRFSGHGKSVEARFSSGEGRGIRRITLHRLLLEHAQAAGAKILWNAPINLNRVGAAKMGADQVRYGFLAGADGENSSIRKQAGLDRRSRDGRRFGFRRHYQTAPWTDLVEVHWGEGCQVYVTPVGSAQVNVALLTRDPELRLTRALDRFPELSARLQNVSATPERGSISASRRLERVTCGRIALIGEASGSVDAVAGYGMSLAFQQATFLADAISAGNLAAYQAAHERIRRRPAFMADCMLLMDNRQRFGRRVLAALSARPSVFADFLSLHAGGFDPRILAKSALTLGWTLLTVS